MNIHNTTQTGSGTQNNNNSDSGNQNINYGRDQINAGRDFVRIFNETVLNPHASLWGAVSGVGASHTAEQQFKRGECLFETREEVLAIIRAWCLVKQQKHPIHWLTGPAGVGKSAIAMSVARACEGRGPISSFFFFRSDPKRNNPSALFPTIAHGLLSTGRLMRRPIERRISRDPTILEAKLEDQFRELVLNPTINWTWERCLWAPLALLQAMWTFFFPLSLVGASLETMWAVVTLSLIAPLKCPSVIIIDGLDECSDEETQLRILSTIRSTFHFQQSPNFPLRFLICSRPESWLQEAFTSYPLRDLSSVTRLDDSFKPDRDVMRYYRHHFQDILSDPKYRQVRFPNSWPSEEEYQVLVVRSCGQFIYAVTVIKFVRLVYSHPVVQLRILLDRTPDHRTSQSPYYELDSLYNVILDANPDHDAVLLILAAILVLPDYLKPSPANIELLLGLPSGQVALTLRAMYSVLDVRGAEDVIVVYHTSFTDYLHDPARSRDFHVDIQAQRITIARKWLQQLTESGMRTFGLVSWIGKYEESEIAGSDDRVTSVEDAHDADNANAYQYPYELGRQKPSSVHLAKILQHKFLTHPRCFHLERFPGVSPQDDITYCTVLFSTRSKEVPLLDCEDALCRDQVSPLLPNRLYALQRGKESGIPEHLVYQDACIRLIKTVISEFDAVLESNGYVGIVAVNGSFENLVDSPLLRHSSLRGAKTKIAEQQSKEEEARTKASTSTSTHPLVQTSMLQDGVEGYPVPETPSLLQLGTCRISLDTRLEDEDVRAGQPARDKQKEVEKAGQQAESRHTLEEELLRFQSLFEGTRNCKKVLERWGDEAQGWLDTFYALSICPGILRRLRLTMLVAVLHLSEQSGMHPKCLTINNVEKDSHIVGVGSSCDVWKGKIANEIVCLKIVRFLRGYDVQELLEEAIVWQQLRHPNLLPFVGMYYFGEGQGQLCLVSPWMERGNLVTFLKDAPPEQVDRMLLAHDIVSGLKYLHGMKLVHRDIKGLNVLITPEMRACIGGFGSYRGRNTDDPSCNTLKLSLPFTVTNTEAGSIRWAAPEVIQGSNFTDQSDMYAYGCVCYEIFTRSVPFFELKNLREVAIRHVQGVQLSRPEGLKDDAVWELMTSCWNYNPSRRPTAADVRKRIRHLSSSRGVDIQDAPDWKSFDMDAIRSNVEYPPLDKLEMLSQSRLR
ncbi:hypothetical protein PQX77_006489 [Marasmius sp. AFHP31]|nr:hypothetical protein PQX77_006489 [Marasmius sp. AFHP31]